MRPIARAYTPTHVAQTKNGVIEYVGFISPANCERARATADDRCHAIVPQRLQHNMVLLFSRTANTHMFSLRLSVPAHTIARLSHAKQANPFKLKPPKIQTKTKKRWRARARNNIPIEIFTLLTVCARAF